MYRHPAYVDISHFRAPYKNLSMQLGGLGAHHHQESNMHYSMYGFGADEPTYATALMNLQDGMHVFKPEVAASVLEFLKQHRVITQGTSTGERLVQVVAYTPEERTAMETSPQAAAALLSANARTWVENEVKNGNVVFAGANILNPTSEEKFMSAIPAKNKKRVREAASVPTSGILMAPRGALTAGLGMMGWVIGIGALAGLGYFFSKKSI